MGSLQHVTLRGIKRRERVESTSGRSEEEEEGKSPSDVADFTELRNFSPTLDKSMPSPWDNKRGSKKKTLELSKPPAPTSLRSPPLKRKGLPKTEPKGKRLGCISFQIIAVEIVDQKQRISG